MASSSSSWLLFAVSLPGREAGTARVRLWRALKDLGAASLRDGVSVLPAVSDMSTHLATLARDVEADGGAAWVFALPRQAPKLDQKLTSLFDRRADYRSLAPTIAELRRELTTLNEAETRRRLRRLEDEFRSIEALDFFPGDPHARLRESLTRLRAAIDRRFSPAEPTSLPGRIAKRQARRFQGARWATRKRLWVDRVASAWLIQRFIDPQARFLWLDKPADCPAGAHGFDFDGATFTHVNDLVTFEVLLAAFDLSDDGGLAGLARLVHYLDIGSGPAVAEAAGFEAVLTGLRDSCADDDALLEATTPVLDALHRHYSAQDK